ncbi:sporulation protein [Bacillus aquiflavi]|uniref:Sporulation protein n=1 Tax=Bacillus aquiflavi TaxID=2672567 RepID=A0A6B3W183_9BACI|nr:CAP domain-containing protein [Bacillus aquiflavi]MBA4537971.1 sporulation protein [Bacillus aquiflavi]NEY82227.1 sporulation protein [Bacillus aquiflavi]UAC49876.1 sporulation protein [Bacillus aquiflavi]
MNKKLFFSVAATAALLLANPVGDKAEAASNNKASIHSKVYVYKTSNFNHKDLNSILQKYKNNCNINWNNGQKAQQPAQPKQDKPVAQQPAQPKQDKPVAQQPAQPKQDKPAAQQPAQPKQDKPAAQQPAQPKQDKPAVQQPAQPKQDKPAVQQPAQPKQEQPAKQAVSSEVSAFEQKVVELTNKERAKSGLPALKLDTELSKVAREKSKDMQRNKYFDHNSPTYGSPFDMMKKFGISYRAAGENIAMGQRSPEEVVNAWMNSDGHRKNILNASFTHIGVGHVEQGNYWTQMFIGK